MGQLESESRGSICSPDLPCTTRTPTRLLDSPAQHTLIRGNGKEESPHLKHTAYNNIGCRWSPKNVISPLHRASYGVCCLVVLTFFMGVGAIGVVLARLVVVLIAGTVHFVVGLARTIVALSWFFLQGFSASVINQTS